MELFKVILTLLCCGFYAHGWYHGEMYPGWVPLMWCFAVFLEDVREYVQAKFD